MGEVSQGSALLSLIRRMDRMDVEMDAIKAELARIHEEGLAVRIAVIETELSTIKEASAEIHDIARKVTEMRAATQSARVVLGLGFSLVVSVAVYAVNTTIGSLHQKIDQNNEQLQAQVEDLKQRLP